MKNLLLAAIVFSGFSGCTTLQSHRGGTATPPTGDLAAAYHTLTSKKFVDLTHSFSPDTPVWFGFGQAKMTPATNPKTGIPYSIANDRFRATFYQMVGQYGTHIDPPAHFSPTGTTMDRIPLKQMILPLVVLDATPYLKDEPSHAFSVENLLAWEGKNGTVPPGSFVALRTDMSKDWRNPQKFKRSPFPAWDFETIKFLYTRRGVTATGHESLDTDTSEKLLSETWLLKHGHYQIEALANLDQLPPTGALIVVTWPKVKAGLGFPARAFAILP